MFKGSFLCFMQVIVMFTHMFNKLHNRKASTNYYGCDQYKDINYRTLHVKNILHFCLMNDKKLESFHIESLSIDIELLTYDSNIRIYSIFLLPFSLQARHQNMSFLLLHSFYQVSVSSVFHVEPLLLLVHNVCPLVFDKLLAKIYIVLAH